MLSTIARSPSGKAPDFDSGIRRFESYSGSQFQVINQIKLSKNQIRLFYINGCHYS